MPTSDPQRLLSRKHADSLHNPLSPVPQPDTPSPFHTFPNFQIPFKESERTEPSGNINPVTLFTFTHFSYLTFAGTRV